MSLIPSEIIGIEKESLTIFWEDGFSQTYSATSLRKNCMCAFCKEEFTGKKLLKGMELPTDLIIKKIELVGQYALQIHFSDSHQTGIYSFRKLREGF